MESSGFELLHIVRSDPPMIKIPLRVKALLEKNHSLHSFVLGAASTVGPWASDNKTPFFPEYTDHSLIHLNEVLASADSLISDEAWSVLNPEDAAVLTIAVLLHDCALHLSEDGFFSLILGDQGLPASRYVKAEKTWALLWSDFAAEAKRFDQRKLRQLFDDTEPIGDLPKNKLSLTLRHRLLIGEFLRRHHARLAHEIALSGIPGPDRSRVAIGSASRELLDLCGFVARSHNLSIRSAVDAIEPNKRRVHHNCHVPFIMSVLRVADYIQVHSPRAPKQLLHLKALVSPISRQEWKKHECIVELNQAHEDPEAIFADAEPKDVATFLSLRLLFQDIQRELDQVWATLGEVYGRFEPLHELGITIRRIRSSLDDSDQFLVNKQPAYIPKHFSFRTASGELMDLLVAPLYGARPEIGVRELVQNAVDACLERDDLIAKGMIPASESPADDVSVTLSIASGDGSTLTVEDFGIGMTVDTIDKYFLNVGASFRSSDLWRKNHEVEGHSNVHRTGRFGVGVLAAFLLGDEITVTTRHVSAEDGTGVSFICRRGDDAIEMRPTSFHFGTKVEVKLSKTVADELLTNNSSKWDWFCLETPKVSRRIEGTYKRLLKQRYIVPSCDASVESPQWNRIDAPGFDDVLWSYEVQSNSYSK